ncbi:hypothetical protein BH10PSE12_BH10PSE12_19550 [soil metagenome]
MIPMLTRWRWAAALVLVVGPLALAPRIALRSSLPAPVAEPIGLTIADSRDRRDAHARAVVTSLMSGGLAARAGIAVGDRVLAIGGRPVANADGARADLRPQAPGVVPRANACTLRVDLRRGGVPLVATLRRCAG